MAAVVRLLRVNSIHLALMKREPPLLAVTVQGLAATPGYSNIRLNVLEDELSPDGIFDLELIGEAPDGIVLQVITPVTASIVIDRDVEKIVGVIVHARSNSLTELLGPGPGAVQQSEASAMAGMIDPDIFSTIQGRPLTTLAIGEEGGTLPLRFTEGTGPFVVEKDPRVEKELRIEKELRLEKDFRLGLEKDFRLGLEKDPRVEGPMKPIGIEDMDPLSGLARRNPFGSR
jgi:hypothetical protein